MMFNDWVYIMVVLIIMSFFLLGCLAGRIVRRVKHRRIAAKIAKGTAKEPPKITGIELEKISKVLGQGCSIGEAKRYARVNCPHHHCLTDDDYRELAGK